MDGCDLVVACAPAGVSNEVARRLAARARQRGAVLVHVADWPAPDLILDATAGPWQGLGAGRGRLRCRQVRVVARGRGGAARPREVWMWLPALSGPLPMVGGQPVLPDASAEEVRVVAASAREDVALNTAGDRPHNVPVASTVPPGRGFRLFSSSDAVWSR